MVEKMNARIEKKLSKRLVGLLPGVYKYAWKEDGVNEQAYSEGNRVKNCFCVGGGVDYWGEVRMLTLFGMILNRITCLLVTFLSVT